MEDTPHGGADGVVVSVDRFGMARWTGRPEFASGGQQRFDGIVSENEEGRHRLQTSG